MRRTIFVCAKHQSLVLIRIESLSEFIQAFFLGPNLFDLFALFFRNFNIMECGLNIDIFFNTVEHFYSNLGIFCQLTFCEL
jgi:hypothetical protein